MKKMIYKSLILIFTFLAFSINANAQRRNNGQKNDDKMQLLENKYEEAIKLRQYRSASLEANKLMLHYERNKDFVNFYLWQDKYFDALDNIENDIIFKRIEKLENINKLSWLKDNDRYMAKALLIKEYIYYLERNAYYLNKMNKIITNDNNTKFSLKEASKDDIINKIISISKSIFNEKNSLYTDKSNEYLVFFDEDTRAFLEETTLIDKLFMLSFGSSYGGIDIKLSNHIASVQKREANNLKHLGKESFYIEYTTLYRAFINDANKAKLKKLYKDNSKLKASIFIALQLMRNSSDILSGEEKMTAINHLLAINKDISKNNSFIKELNEIKTEILRPKLYVNNPNNYHYIDRNLKIVISHSMLSAVRVQINKIDDYKTFVSTSNRNDKLLGKKYDTKEFTFEYSKDRYSLKTDTITLKLDDYGYYDISIEAIENKNAVKSNEKIIDFIPIIYTDKVALGISNTQNKYLQILDAKSGKPQKGRVAFVDADQRNNVGISYIQSQSKQLDKNAIIENQGGRAFFLDNSKTPFFVDSYIYRPDYNIFPEGPNVSRISSAIILDRNLYNREDTVRVFAQFASITKNIRMAKALADRGFNLYLRKKYDNKNIISQKLKTNEFGVIDTFIKLPKGLDLGAYDIVFSPIVSDYYVIDRETSFTIADFEKASFDIKLKGEDIGYKYGDKAKIKSIVKYLSGDEMKDYKLTYTINRIDRAYDPNDWWRISHYKYRDEETIEQSIDLDKSEYDIYVDLKEQKNRQKGLSYNSSYIITAKVTASNGETRENKYFITVGDLPYTVEADIKKAYNIDRDSIAFTANISNESNQNILDKDILVLLKDKKSNIIAEVKSKSAKEIKLSNINKLDDGNYNIEIYLPNNNDDINKIKKGEIKANLKKEIYLYRNTSKSYEGNDTDLWVDFGESSYRRGNFPEIAISTTSKKAYVFVRISAEDKEVANEMLEIKKRDLHRIDLKKYQIARDTREININIYTLQNAKLSSLSNTYTLERENKSLDIVWHSFRDRANSNSEEKISIELTKDGKAVDASVLAFAYDKALDLIKERRDLYINPRRLYINDVFSNKMKYQISNLSGDLANTPMLFNAVSTTRTLKGMQDDLDIAYENAPMGDNVVESITTEKNIDIRSDFRNTAFWKSDLRTDKNGKVDFSFKTPDNLGAWRIVLYANTKDMNEVLATKTMEVYKLFALRLNKPRFIRLGDRLDLMSSLSNNQKEDYDITYQISIIDRDSKELLFEDIKKVSIKAGETTPIISSLDINDKNFTRKDGLLPKSVIVKAIAKNEKGISDGEQFEIPFISNEVEISEANAIFISGKKKETKKLSDLVNISPNYKNAKIDISASGNPLYYILESLPVILKNDGLKNAYDISSSIYSYSLALSLIDKTNIKEWINSNENVFENKENLKYHEKEIDAEKENKEFLKLFVENRGKNIDINTKISLLTNLQKSDGGFSWFEGMKSNIYTSIFVYDMLQKTIMLDTELSRDAKIKDIYLKLEKYIIAQMGEYRKVNYSKRKKKDIYPSSFLIDMVYLLRNSQSAMSKKDKANYDFFYSILSKNYLKVSNFDKAKLAILLHEKDAKKAKDLAKSLREDLSKKGEELYFAKYKFDSNYERMNAMSMITDAIECFELIYPRDTELVNGLILYMINQKRGQVWTNSIVTSKAIHSIATSKTSKKYLSKNNLNIELTAKNKDKIKMSGSVIDTSILVEDIDIKHTNISFEPQKKSNIWANVATKYTTTIDNVSASKTKGLTVSKKIAVSKVIDGKEELVEISPNSPLSLGSKVAIVLDINSDKALDFVEISVPMMTSNEYVDQLPQYIYQNGIGYYYIPSNDKVSIYLDTLAKGNTKIYIYQLVQRAGNYVDPFAEIHSTYDESFKAHSASSPNIEITNK